LSLVARPLNAAQRKPGLAFIPDRPVMRAACGSSRPLPPPQQNIQPDQHRQLAVQDHFCSIFTAFRELTSQRQTSNRSESAATNLA
jgi:hypothetical protein